MSSNKVRIFLLGRDKVGWSIDRDREAIFGFLKGSNFEITDNIFKATHILCVWYDFLLGFKYSWMFYFKRIFNKRIIVVITNDITFFPEKLNSLRDFVDAYIVPSEKLYRFFKGQKLKAYRIPFFVDPNIFKSLSLTKEEICKKISMKYGTVENKIVIGSFQRDSIGGNLTKPKWQKNPDLLIEILEKLPRKKFTLLLAGPRRHYIINKCMDKNINFVFYGKYSYFKNFKDDILVNNLSLETINYLYNLSDIYIVTSRSEGGPKQVLESALTKTIIFSTNVGLAPDILSPELIYNNVEVLLEKIKTFLKDPESFKEIIEYNYQKAKKEMDESKLKELYKEIILENI